MAEVGFISAFRSSLNAFGIETVMLCCGMLAWTLRFGLRLWRSIPFGFVLLLLSMIVYGCILISSTSQGRYL